MTKERTLDMSYQNMELEVSKIIKEEEYAKVIKAYVERNTLTMVFEPNEERKYPTYVKQVSKKKYNCLSGFFRKVLGQGGLLSCVVETPKMWLLFFEK